MTATNRYGAWCDTAHHRVGIVSNQDRGALPDFTRPHSSVSVCADPDCLEKAARHVSSFTGEASRFYPDEAAR